MGKSSAPQPPDPRETAAAQTGSNVATAVANAWLNNFNQRTPTGALTFRVAGPDAGAMRRIDRLRARMGAAPADRRAALRERIQGIRADAGSQSFTDPASGQTYQIPRLEAVQSLTPQQRRIQAANEDASLSMARLGRAQARRLGGVLGTDISTDGLPAVGGVPTATRAQEGIGEAGGAIYDAIGDAGDITSAIGPAGPLTRSYGTDFSSDRQRVEDAIMSRLNPSLDRDRESLRTSLINQGIREGSAAFDRAMNRQNEAGTDARMQAILAGGQEQSRMAALERDRALFENDAQAQAFGQEATRGAFFNDAQAQRFGQQATRTSMANDAQAQRFGQEAQRAAFANAARGQNFTADMARDAAEREARNAALTERFAVRNQPINEIAALLGGGQVTLPQFVNPTGAQIPTTDYAGLVNSNFAMQSENVAQRNAQRAAMLGSIFGAGGDIGSAFLLG